MNAPYRPDHGSDRATLEAALAERDRRRTETDALLRAGARSVIRLSSRLPYSLREQGAADDPVRRGADVFQSACRERGLTVRLQGTGNGVLGPWWLWTSSTSPDDLKSSSLYIEEGSWLGQLLDIDVASVDGPASRSSRCLPPRPCVVCGGAALACAGRNAHASAEVDAAFTDILRRSVSAHHFGSPDHSAVGAEPSLTIEEIKTKGGDTP